MVNCLLCSGLLPRNEQGIVEMHMQDHHRVFSNLPMVVAATNLDTLQLEVVTKMVLGMERTVEHKDEYLLDFPKQSPTGDIPEDVKENQSFDESDIKEPMSDDLDPKFEVESESDEEEYKPIVKKRNYPKERKKCLSMMGKIDKQIAKIYKPDLGRCVCPICAKEFIITDELIDKEYRRHIYHHRVTKFDCDCAVVHEQHKHNHPKKFHIYTEHRGSFHCTTCAKSFKEDCVYQEHLTQLGHGGNGPSLHICDQCGFTAKNQYYLTNHKAYKHDSNVVTCEFCAEQFPGRLKMMMHRRRAHINAGKKQCPYCGSSFSQLWRHIKTMHTDDKDKLYNCEHCGKGFVDNNRMQAHLRSAHTGEKPFACRYMCGAACAEAGNRKKHEVTRHGREWSEQVDKPGVDD